MKKLICKLLGHKYGWRKQSMNKYIYCCLRCGLANITDSVVEIEDFIREIENKKIYQTENWASFVLTKDRKLTTYSGEMMAIGYNQAIDDVLDILRNVL